jgi:hypothetical protein
MSRRSSNRSNRDEYEATASPEFTRLILLTMGIAMALGLMAGLAWTAYHLIWLRWFA